MKPILVALDGSPLAERALNIAADLARRASMSLALVRVELRRPARGESDSRQRAEVAEEYLSLIAEGLKEKGLSVEVVTVVARSVTDGICDVARRLVAPLVVMATHGRSGLGRWVYGSVAESMMRRTECSLLLVPSSSPDTWPAEPFTVLVPLDGSDLAETALEPASMLARWLGARLRLLRVVEPLPIETVEAGVAFEAEVEEAELEEARRYLDDIAARIGDRVETLVAEGRAARTIARFAMESECGVVVMGTHGRTGMARFLMGSVAASLLPMLSVPVLVIRPPL